MDDWERLAIVLTRGLDLCDAQRHLYKPDGFLCINWWAWQVMGHAIVVEIESVEVVVVCCFRLVFGTQLIKTLDNIPKKQTTCRGVRRSMTIKFEVLETYTLPHSRNIIRIGRCEGQGRLHAE